MARHDVFVPNESDGFVVASGTQHGRGLMPGEAAWNEAVSSCLVLPVTLDREDPVVVRVVVGEGLEPAEESEWIGRIQGGLRVPDGQLALCGGAAWLIDPEPWTEDYVRLVPIPAGDYRAVLHVYLSAPNAQSCLEQAGLDEGLGAWFRRTRAGHPTPAWLHNTLVNDPDQDPGHQRAWKGAEEKPGVGVVDLLLHLEPADGAPGPAPTAEDGFGAVVEVRALRDFPLGLAARNLVGHHAEDA